MKPVISLLSTSSLGGVLEFIHSPLLLGSFLVLFRAAGVVLWRQFSFCLSLQVR